MLKIKNKKKILVLLFFCFLMVFMSGCASVPVTRETTKNPKTGSTIMKETDDAIYVTDGNGGWEEMVGSIHEVQLTPTTDYKFTPKDSDMLLRDIATLMYQSIFTNPPVPGDNFVTNKWDPISLEPITLVEKINTTTSNEIKNNTTLDALTSGIGSLAGGILIVIWSMGFISQVVNERFTPEVLLKTFMQLICGIMLIQNADTIVAAFIDAGNLLMTTLGNPGQSGNVANFTAFATEISNGMKTGIKATCIALNLSVIKHAFGCFWSDNYSLTAIALMAFPFIMQLRCAFQIVSILVTRMFELIIRITFAPIPLAFSAQSGFTQESIRYFRGVFACALQPVLMMVGAACIGVIATTVMKIFGNMTAGSITGASASIAMGLSYVILSAYMGQTRQLAHEIIGH